jgi:hypothetical protein
LVLKKQNSNETPSFGSEIIAVKQGVEISEGVWYKLRMMGVLFNGHTYIKAVDMLVIKNSSISESMLKNKSNPMACHKGASGSLGSI